MALFDPIVEGEKALHHLETAAAALVDVVRVAPSRVSWPSSPPRAAVRSHPDDTRPRYTAPRPPSLASSPRLRTARSLVELDVVVGELQLAERAVFRAESLLARPPRASVAHSRSLTSSARVESVRETDISRASRLVVSARVVDALRAVPPRARRDLSTPSSIEYAVRASPRARTIADHGLRGVTRDDLVRASVRISRRRAFERLGAPTLRETRV